MQNTKNKTLNLVLTHKWFDEIAFGRKQVEYRRGTQYWLTRIRKMRDCDFVVFHRGYTNQTMIRLITRIEYINGRDVPAEERKYLNVYNDNTVIAIHFI
ncbi:hypothetical protein AAIR98_001453 [Elusimicrobium simillimum]|uniref:hypothetical protein n=1 Tax=Elusimicrobium simillimum TaxID=3143438 RepID=UPI003C6ECD40